MQFRLHSLLIAAVATLAFVGCTSDDDFAPSGEKKSLSFVATLDGRTHKSGASERMKTQLHPDQQNSVSFVADDAISVFSDKENNKFTTTDNGGSATFKGEAKETQNYYALYPYQSAATINGTTISANFPATQTAQTGAPYFDPQAALSVASTDNDSREFYFYNVGCLVKFETEEPYEKIVFRGKSGEYVAGTVNIAVGATPSVTGANAQSITLQPDASFDDGRLIPAGIYYIAVLPQNFAAGFTVEAYHPNNTSNTPDHIRTINKNITLDRSRVYEIGKLKEIEREAVDLDFTVTEERDGKTYEITWAITNIGAEHEYDTGDYFAWGEVMPKGEYSWATYKWGKYTPAKGLETPLKNELTKYCSESQVKNDNKYELEDEDNAAKYNWGPEWDIPSRSDFAALVASTTQKWDVYPGTEIYGMFFISKKDPTKKIFIPDAGYQDGVFGGETCPPPGIGMATYWSSDRSTYKDPNDGDRVHEEKAHIIQFSEYDVNADNDAIEHRYCGMPIRPVKRVIVTKSTNKKR